MAYEIIWLPKAEERFDEIINWLQKHWTSKEIAAFINRTEEVVLMIQNNPLLYRKSTKSNIHEAIITKQVLLLYRRRKNTVELLTFFDTRQNPTKKFRL